MVSVIKKVPGGKLFRLDTEEQAEETKVMLTGDFFLHPEEKIIAFNEFLTLAYGQEKPFSELWEKYKDKDDLMLVGMDIQDLDNALEELRNES